jgi:predicted MPP superfamily phosphohydrolase
MIPYLLFLAAFAIGHAALVIWPVNVAHGLGFRSSRTEPITLVVLSLMGAITLATMVWIAGHGYPAWPLALRVYAGACVAVAVLGLPAAEIARRLRPGPGSVLATSTETHDLAGTIQAGSGRASWLLAIPGNQSALLQVKDCRIALPDLPPTLEGLTVVHLTDLHMAPALGRRYFEAVADRAARFEPDLVLCTGDIVEHLDAIPWVAPVLGRLRGRLGQFAILGNHDAHYRPDRIRDVLADAGFLELDGRWERVDADGQAIALGGTAAPWGPRLERAAMPGADLRIVLSHTPDQFPRIARWGAVDLILAGHNHGGQVRLPLVGPVLMPSRYSRRYDRGVFRSGSTLMYVGQGIGAKHPVRINCPPELTRLVLVRDPIATDLEPGDALTAAV